MTTISFIIIIIVMEFYYNCISGVLHGTVVDIGTFSLFRCTSIIQDFFISLLHKYVLLYFINT